MNHETQEQAAQEGQAKGQGHIIHFTIDGELYETHERELTPDQILTQFAHVDPVTHYLVQIHGNHQESYKGKGCEPIKLHEGMQFQVVSTGPTPVSDPNRRFGVDAFVHALRTLGFAPIALPDKADHMVFDYVVPTGLFAGRAVRLGFVVPADFPLTPPSGPYISPHIHPIKTDGHHPTGGIHQSQAEPFQRALGGEWQYWSRPYPDWATGKKTVAAYLSHIWRLWDSQ